MLSLVVGLVPKLLMGLVIMRILQKLSVIHTLLSSHLTTNRTITSCSRNFKHIMLITLVTMLTLIVCSLSNWLQSDELQFAFKKGRGCRDAIFTFRGIITHITSNSSTATLCVLDVAKAFGKTNHFRLYMKLTIAISECSH